MFFDTFHAIKDTGRHAIDKSLLQMVANERVMTQNEQHITARLFYREWITIDAYRITGRARP